jgi:mannose-1-phosphate guanylyltransferase
VRRRVQAVILAGGLGTRLWPLTMGLPKPLLSVMDRPLLAHLMERLPPGVDEVFLAVSFQAPKMQAWVDQSDDPALGGRRVHVVTEDPPLGTGGALAHLADKAGLGRDGKPFFVLNGDLLSAMDLSGLLEAHKKNGGLSTIFLVEVDDPSRFGVVDLSDKWQIRRFVEKPPRDQAPSNWVNAGAYVVDPEVLAGIPRGRAVSLEREVFPLWVESKRGMWGRPHRGLWVDCGTRESYLHAHRMFMMQGEDGGRVAAGPGPWKGYLQSGVEVSSQACLKGSVVHQGAVVKADAVVRDSILGAGAVVGRGAHVDRCIVAPGARVRDGLRVEDARIVDEAGG